MKPESRFIPALSYHWLTPLYDPVVRWTTRERAVKAALLDQADLQPGDRVLDLACGTGTLAIAVKQLHPDTHVVGLDGDEAILARAAEKAQAAGVSVRFDHALSNRMPYDTDSFDVVMSTLFFHHLDRNAKLATLAEVRRVLKPGGELHIADWGRPGSVAMDVAFLLVRLLDGFEATFDNMAGLLPDLMRNSGFRDVSETRSFDTALGTISLYVGVRPASHG